MLLECICADLDRFFQGPKRVHMTSALLSNHSTHEEAAVTTRKSLPTKHLQTLLTATARVDEDPDDSFLFDMEVLSSCIDRYK